MAGGGCGTVPAMEIERAALEERFRDLSDEELLERLASGVLTELAAEVAHSVAVARGLDLLQHATAAADAAAAVADAMPAHGALRVCATFLNPVAAEALAARLMAAGLAPQTLYANGGVLGSVGLDGVRVLVPESQLEDASRIRTACDAGEFAIDEDFDVNR